MSSAETVTLIACGVFFLTGLLSGIWKWRAMVRAADHRAPFYVDTAHRAALLYSFACLVLRAFVEHSPFSDAVDTVAVLAPITFFAVAIGTYLLLGFSDRTDNQFERETPVQRFGMLALVVAEVGGFAVLFAGFLLTRLGG